MVLWKLDRLSRNLRDGLNVLIDWCDRGLRVVSTTQQIDFNGSLGKMLAAVLLGVAEMEQETRRRTPGGRNQGGTRARRLPRPPPRHHQSQTVPRPETPRARPN